MINALSNCTYTELSIAFNDAMADCPFDTVWDKLYRAYDVSWYITSNDARDVARRLFENSAEDILQCSGDEATSESGCLQIVFTNMGYRVNCEISWVCSHTGNNCK
jgi:hypothetical protein